MAAALDRLARAVALSTVVIAGTCFGALGDSREDAFRGLVGSKLGKGPRDLHSMAAALQTLAKSVVNGSEYLSETQREVLKDIGDEMDRVIDGVAANHKEDQGEVDRVRELVAGCSVPDAEIESSRAITASEEASHSQCRSEEKEAKARKGSACNLYWSISGSQDPPPCMATYNPTPKPAAFDSTITCLREIIAWAKPLNISLTVNKDLCKKATEEQAQKVLECNHEQTEYEIAFCSYHEKLTGACSAYTTCRTTTTKQRSDVHAAVEIAEKGRKAEHSAAERVKCFLGVFSASPEEQPTKLQACIDINPDTTSLDIKYHELPAELTCDIAPVATYPCDAQWLGARYESKDWYSDAPTKACTACVHLTEQPASKQSSGGDTAEPAPAPQPATPAPQPAEADTPAPTPAPLDIESVLIGSSTENKKCVDAKPGVHCPPNSGNKYIRVNRDYWGRDNSYEVTMEGGQVCARRLDLPHGWDMELRLRCE